MNLLCIQIRISCSLLIGTSTVLNFRLEQILEHQHSVQSLLNRVKTSAPLASVFTFSSSDPRNGSSHYFWNVWSLTLFSPPLLFLAAFSAGLLLPSFVILVYSQFRYSAGWMTLLAPIPVILLQLQPTSPSVKSDIMKWDLVFEWICMHTLCSTACCELFQSTQQFSHQSHRM